MKYKKVEVGSLVHIEGLKFVASVVAIDFQDNKALCCYYSQKIEGFDLIPVDICHLTVKEEPKLITPSPGMKLHVAGYSGYVLVDSDARMSENKDLQLHGIHEVTCLYDAGGKWAYGVLPVAALQPAKAFAVV